MSDFGDFFAEFLRNCETVRVGDRNVPVIPMNFPAEGEVPPEELKARTQDGAQGGYIEGAEDVRISFIFNLA